MKASTPAALLFVLCGCAATYERPVTAYQPTIAAVSGSKAELMRKVRQVLVLEGFQITSADEGAGVIVTSPRDFRLTPAQADCGTTMGIDYLKDNRTDTKLGYGMVVADGKVTVRTTLEAQYKPGTVSQNITLSCVSRGSLEADMLRQIQSAT